MQQEPVEMTRNDWGVILEHRQWQTVELRWLPSTREMTDEGFKATLELLAEAGERVHPRFMLIDAYEFHHEFGDGVMAWREENVIPRYSSAGVAKFAFLVPEGAPGTVESGGTPIVEGPATFPTGWFSTRERAYQWLAE
jgi:hypothetical protein